MTPEQIHNELEEKFKQDPEWVYVNRPRWLHNNHPEWMKERNPLYFYLIDSSFEVACEYVKNNLDEVEDKAPRWIYENPLEYAYIKDPNNMMRINPYWCIYNHEIDICKNFPNSVFDLYPVLVYHHNPEWVRLHRPDMYTIFMRSYI